MAKAPLIPYKVLTTLLYGRFGWLERHPGGLLTAPTAPLVQALGLRRAPRLHGALEWLQVAGLVESYRWYRGSVAVRVAAPAGTGWTVEAPRE